MTCKNCFLSFPPLIFLPPPPPVLVVVVVLLLLLPEAALAGLGRLLISDLCIREEGFFRTGLFCALHLHLVDFATTTCVHVWSWRSRRAEGEG